MTNHLPRSKQKRPFWVWIISAFFLFSGVMNLSMLWLILTGNVNLPAEELETIRKTSMLWTLGGLLPLANLAGAVSLFMLRKIAFYIFSGMLIAGLANGVVQLFLLDWSLQTISHQGLIQVVVGYFITFAVCIYAYLLKKQNVLW
ncbi:MAG: hypothetical protein KGY61_02430 [Desulfobacterales bacterium]|nr:hypothetical protein [Desulfobacterales bacterium]